MSTTMTLPARAARTETTPDRGWRWTSRLDAEHISPWLQAAVEAGLLDTERPAAIFHDLEQLRWRLRCLRQTYPSATHHTVAIKANPVVEILRVIADEGFGLEAATIEEVYLALAAGCSPEHVVYDSPARTPGELEMALQAGVGLINADNLDELARITRRVAALGTSGTRIGLRVNPVVGDGSIGLTSVAGPRSRFGQPMLDGERDALAAAILDRAPDIGALHVHVGSQGCGVELLAEGVARVAELALAIDRLAGRRQIEVMDIGGGLPVAYRATDTAICVERYVAALRERAPSLFDGTRRLVTELGRSVQAPCGWAASRVETVKRLADGRHLASLHLGADFAPRTAYLPEDWHLEVSVYDARGRIKSPGDAGLEPWTLAGPLCFGGDLMAVDRPLPRLEPGDLVVLHDVGAYTLSMWSRHCSRGIPAVYGHDTDRGLQLLRAAERPEDVVRFWSRGV